MPTPVGGHLPHQEGDHHVGAQHAPPLTPEPTTRPLTRHDDAPKAEDTAPGTGRRASFASGSVGAQNREPASASQPTTHWVMKSSADLRKLPQTVDETATRAVKLQGYFGPGELRNLPAWVKALDLSECRGFTAAMLDDLAPLGLKSLDVSGHPIGTWKATAALAQLQTLTELSANGCDLRDADMEGVATLSNLTSVSLRRNSIGSRGAEIILRNDRLLYIDFADNELGTLGALAIANDRVSRNWIGMGGNHIGVVGTDALKRRVNTGGVAISGISGMPDGRSSNA